MRHGRTLLAVVWTMAFVGGTVWTLAQPPKAEEPDENEDEAKEKAVSERFRKVLEGNPRRGTALDKFYGYHVERGTLDTIIAEYAGRTKKDAKDGASWTVIGLMEAQRGRDGAAVAAFA